MNVFKRIQRTTPKHMVVAGGFVLAMAAAVGLGLATKQFSLAAAQRDCDNNAIMRCGAVTPKEFISDVKSFNANTQTKQADLQTIYSHFGLSPSEYDRFQSTARMGTVDNKGVVKVDGQTVMTGAWSMGRQSFGNPNRKPLKIGSKTYYSSPTSISFASGVTSIPVMVMFNSKGGVEIAAMTACGNPVWGTNVTPEYDCKALNSKKIADDTYDFSTTVHVAKNASVNKVVYDFGDGTTVTKTNPAEVVRHKYAKAGSYTAKVTAYFNLPGKQVAVVPAVKCATKVTVVEPFYACDALSYVALNTEKTKFRFTVKARYGNGATLKDADFTADNATITGVAPQNGVISKDYTFARDGKTHTVTAKVNFNIASKVASVTCQAEVEAGKTPECKPGIPVGSPECEACEVPGKETLPKNSPECVENCTVEGKETLPKDSTECVETPPELPHTGMGSMLGLFAGTSAFGAVAHRVVANRRRQ